MTSLLTRCRTANPSALCFAASATTLGHALQISNGTFNEGALTWVCVAFVLCGLGTLSHAGMVRWTSHGALAANALLISGVMWNLAQALAAKPGVYLESDANLLLFAGGLVLEGGLILVGVSRWKAARRLWFPLVLVTHLLLGTWLIQASPNPAIDVVVVHKAAMDALLSGSDPYRISFPNIYGDNWRAYYNPAVVFGDQIGFGYPYPPLSLLLAMPGYVLFGDYRYSELAFLIGAAVLIGYCRKHMTAQLAATMLLTTPRGFFVLEQGWTEPIAVCLVALTTFLLTRGPVRASWAAGLMLATKQYLPFTGLAVLRSLLLDRRRWKLALLVLVCVGAASTLPFALWHQNSFMRSVVWLQTQEPFREDALSLLVWADRHGYGRGSFLWAVGAATAIAFVSLATTRNSPSGFATCTAMTMFAMFVFGSKAFCNYYYFVIGAICCAIAAVPGPEEPEVLPDTSGHASDRLTWHGRRREHLRRTNGETQFPVTLPREANEAHN